MGSSLKTYFQNFFTPPVKFGGGKRRISPTRRQLEARNFETVQHIDKQNIHSEPEKKRGSIFLTITLVNLNRFL